VDQNRVLLTILLIAEGMAAPDAFRCAEEVSAGLRGKTYSSFTEADFAWIAEVIARYR